MGGGWSYNGLLQAGRPNYFPDKYGGARADGVDCNELLDDCWVTCVDKNGKRSNPGELAGLCTCIGADTNRFFNAKRLADFQSVCSERNFHIGDVFTTCMTTQQFNGLDVSGQYKSWAVQASDSMLLSAQRVFDNIENACGKGTFDLAWPYFYQDYKTDQGKREIDQFLAKNPQVRCENEIRNCMQDGDLQRRFQFMNQSARCLRDTYEFPVVNNWNWYGTDCPEGQVGYDSGWALYLAQACPYPKETFTDTLLDFGWQIGTDGGFHLAKDPTDPDQNDGRFVDPGAVGDPYDNLIDRTRNQKLAFGFIPRGPGGANQPKDSTVKGYTGHLPIYHEAANQYNPIENPPYKGGGAGKTYKDPCLSENILQKVLPVITSAFMFIFTNNVIIGEYFGKIVISGSVAGATFFQARAALGLMPPTDPLWPIPHYTENSYQYQAASILTIGVPLGGISMLFESGKFTDLGIPSEAKFPILLVGTAASFVLLGPPVEVALKFGDKLAEIVTLPISVTLSVLQKLFNGCYTSHWFHFDGDCICSDADIASGGKSSLISDWLDVYYQTTGEQRNMRKSCLEMEMQRGGWKATGADTDIIGKCVGNKMENPTACLSSGGWTFGPPDYDTVARQPLEEQMWEQIYHCLDPRNPSMLPPVTDKDRVCQQKFGEHYRWDSVANSCRNQILPGLSWNMDSSPDKPSEQFPIGGNIVIADPTIGHEAENGGNKGCVIF